MSASVIVTDISEILGKGLDISEIIKRDLPYSAVARLLDDNGRGSVASKLQKLDSYMEQILERNEHVNLTAITDREDFIRKHYEDSLSLLGFPEYEKAETILDLGTGGGFPGVPLAVADERKDFTLVDSLAKRLTVIDEICSNLSIQNVRTLHGRAEDLGRSELRETFDLVVSRAVADMSVLAEYCLPFLKEGGVFIAYKKADCSGEISNAEKAIGTLGGKVNRIETYGYGIKGKSGDASDRIAERAENAIVVIDKIDSTPDKYPRKAGIPSKRPL